MKTGPYKWQHPASRFGPPSANYRMVGKPEVMSGIPVFWSHFRFARYNRWQTREASKFPKLTG